MKVAVSSSGKDLDSQIDPRFGRCAYFLIVDAQDMSLEVFTNENTALSGGAGISSAQFLVSKNGALRPSTEANVADHYGMGGTGPIGGIRPQTEGGRMGMGRGMGRGRRMGGGRGMGRGVGMPGWDVPNQLDLGGLSKEQELKVIREQSIALTKQLEEIEARIKKLEHTD
jgi:hypothetical protein